MFWNFLTVFLIRSQIGTLHIGPYHQVSVSQADLYIPLNFHVYLGGHLDLPAQVKLYNLDCSINGSVGGVEDLIMVASTLKLEDAAKSAGVTTNRLFQFQAMNLLSRSVLEMTGPERYKISSGEISLGPGSQIKGTQLTLAAERVTVSEGAVVDLSSSGSAASGQGKPAQMPH